MSSGYSQKRQEDGCKHVIIACTTQLKTNEASITLERHHFDIFDHILRAIQMNAEPLLRHIYFEALSQSLKKETAALKKTWASLKQLQSKILIIFKVGTALMVFLTRIFPMCLSNDNLSDVNLLLSS